MTDKIKQYNNLLLSRLSLYINNCPDAITEETVLQTAKDCFMSKQEAFKLLLSGALDLYDEKELRKLYLDVPGTVKLLDVGEYENDPYYKSISLSDIRYKSWSVETKKYRPYELFCYNDLVLCDDGRILPRVGFFDREFHYPCILQNGREWMLITPNEIETMKKPVADAFGNVMTYGLGLGYFAFMAARKEEVKSVTVIEKDADVTDIFTKYILPQFDCSHKITVKNCDAMLFAAEQKTKKISDFDFVFADIWHDASDGKELYLILKSLERKDTRYSYWIEDTIKCYL